MKDEINRALTLDERKDTLELFRRQLNKRSIEVVLAESALDSHLVHNEDYEADKCRLKRAKESLDVLYLSSPFCEINHRDNPEDPFHHKSENKVWIQ